MPSKEAIWDGIPAAQREQARAALNAVAGESAILALAPVSGGASGAGIFRADAADGRRLLLRIEGPAGPLLRRNPHRHLCARIAADAGLSPAVLYLDEANGVSVTDFIEHRPLATFPGGQPALAAALGVLIGQLQRTVAFPPLIDYRDLMADMLARVDAAGVFAAGVLSPCFQRLAQLRADCPWDADAHVAAHNDPNAGNILFDGERLWLIDWEGGYRNDPLVDIAILLDGLAPTPQLEDRLLAAWLGCAPDAAVRERLSLIRPLTRLYYACFMLTAARPPGPPDDTLSAPTAPDLERAARSGRLQPNSPQALHTLGKVFLSGFLTGDPLPGLAGAVWAVFGRTAAW